MKKQALTVLISSAGRRGALLQCFRSDAELLDIELRIIAIDMKPEWSAACAMADASYAAPRCTTKEFQSFVLDLCRREKVDLAIPTIDTELTAFNCLVDPLAAIGTRAVISSLDVINLSRDKARTAVELARAGIPTPRTAKINEFDAEDHSWAWPILIKPTSGSSSAGVRIMTRNEFLANRPRGDVIVQERLVGSEFTVNLFFDRAGKLRCAIPHLRFETRAGEVSKGETVRLPVLEDIANRLGSTLIGAQGPLCYQAIIGEDGEAALFEINARFGGGYPLAREAGAPFTRWLLEEAAGQNCSANNSWHSGVRMLRYDTAIFS